MNSYKRRLAFKQLYLKGTQNIFDYLPPIKDYFFTESVRGGIEAIINLLWKDTPGKVLLPVFVAEGVIRPFKKKKFQLYFTN